MDRPQTQKPSGPTILKPETPAQLLDAVQWALADDVPLDLTGSGTKRDFGRPVEAAHALDLSALAGVTLYEPEELTLTAGTGTPLAEIKVLLAGCRQQLAFEPPDLGPLLGGDAGRQTLGGVVACNLAGPRRVKAGAARDHLLGFQAVSGHGQAFKAGGRVVKNVTGYDLSKLVAGSFGTLVALTEVTLKVLPAPETERTILLFGLDDGPAIAALSHALQSPYEVAGAAHLPAWAAARARVSEGAGAGTAVTAIRLEGVGPSIAYRAGRLEAELAAFGAVGALDAEASAALWRDLRDVGPLVQRPDALVWRLSVPPSTGPAVVAQIRRSLGVDAFYDWGGGLVWLGLEAAPDAGAATVRAAVAPTGGHATLVRAPAPVRARVDVFQPQPAPLAALSTRVKHSYDPRRIFNRGRMYAGV